MKKTWEGKLANKDIDIYLKRKWKVTSVPPQSPYVKIMMIESDVNDPYYQYIKDSAKFANPSYNLMPSDFNSFVIDGGHDLEKKDHYHPLTSMFKR